MPALKDGKYTIGLRIEAKQFERLEALRASCRPIPTRTDLLLQLINEATNAHLDALASVQSAPTDEPTDEPAEEVTT